MKIALLGYGRMGKAIEQIALERGHEIVLRIGRHNLADLTIPNLQQADVAIDFSLPNTAFSHIKYCLTANIPVISGTTAWTEKLPEAIEFCKEKNGAFLYASNFSIGVNIFFEINKTLARLMNNHPNYEIDMDEIHHIHKLDSPSGTGLTLANQIIENIDRKTQWTEGYENNPENIAIHSRRIGMTSGTHGVNYRSDIDTIEIKHTAHSRQGFALGAVIAAEWIQDKKGYFTMKDVLGI